MHQITSKTFFETYVLPKCDENFERDKYFTAMQELITGMVPATIWAEPHKEVRTFCELLRDIWLDCQKKATADLVNYLQTLQPLCDLTTEQAKYSEFLNRARIECMNQYKQVLKGQTSWAACVKKLFEYDSPLFAMEFKKPRPESTLYNLSADVLHKQLEENALSKTLPEEKLAKQQDRNGNTLLHLAMLLYPTLHKEAQQKVHLLCLLSDPDVKNQAGQTPLDCLEYALSTCATLTEGVQKALLADVATHVKEARQYATQSIEIVQATSLAHAMTDRATRAEERNGVLEAENIGLKTENTGLKRAKECLEIRVADRDTIITALTIENADLAIRNGTQSDMIHNLEQENADFAQENANLLRELKQLRRGNPRPADPRLFNGHTEHQNAPGNTPMHHTTGN